VDKFSSKLRIGEKIGDRFRARRPAVRRRHLALPPNPAARCSAITSNCSAFSKSASRWRLKSRSRWRPRAMPKRASCIQRQERFAGEVDQHLQNDARKGGRAGGGRSAVAADGRRVAGLMTTYEESVPCRRRRLAEHGTGRELRNPGRLPAERSIACTNCPPVQRRPPAHRSAADSPHEKDLALRQDPAYRERFGG
jgi:hypothetical protein